ncbi:FAD-binding oxidoreductase [Roseibium denhamense]|uniref:Sarcosine oxidase subunit beta n=1 Tax=Roseibium denhamense TaxID=76305 RepID=A0ABY1NIB7_9HYPH|nr:FAD-dependent oxidoreductase [Roseibium denhamense]MTI06721.1 FAD-binding oxidoreductase [Roseibium denhamense]SMP10592.1 sarcosine oxidase subunit beta [Roseibium denhamense]
MTPETDSHLRHDARYDAIIIGAGVIGCAIAYNLAKRGYRTLNIDQLPAPGYGSTSSSAAVVRTYYSTLDGSALAYEGFFEWKNWPDYVALPEDTDLAKLIETGTLVMRTEGNDHLSRILESADALKIAYEIWDAGQIQAALPGYDLTCFAPVKTMDDDRFGEPAKGEITSAAYFPSGGYVDDPQLAARNLKTAAERAGGQFLFNSKVTRICVENGRAAGAELADGRRVSRPIIVNVAGPHSAKVNALLDDDPGLNIQTRPLKQEVVQVQPPSNLGYTRQGLIVADDDVGVYVKPSGGGHLMIGSMNPPCDDPVLCDPDDFSRDLTDRALTYAYRYSQRLPALGVSQHPAGLADLYDASDDWLPIYDKSDVPGYYMAIGTNGNQFKNAPVAGRMMADLIAYCENGADHDLEPLQFPLKQVRHTINTATFSRKRQPNNRSSFSVIG